MSVLDYVLYDADGRIVMQMNAQPDMIADMAKQHGGLRFIEAGAARMATHYVSRSGVLMLRQKNPAVLDGMTLRNLPPSRVTIEGKTYRVDDGQAELSFAYPGTYQVLVESFPYLDATFQVTV